MGTSVVQNAKSFFLTDSLGTVVLSPRFCALFEGAEACVPVKTFEELQEHLLALTNLGRSSAISSELDDLRANLLQPVSAAMVRFAQQQKLSPWGMAVGILTIEVLANAFKAIWAEDFWKHYSPALLSDFMASGISYQHRDESKDPFWLRPVLFALDELYKGPAQKSVAAPLQFYCLCQLCSLRPELIDRALRVTLGKTYELDEYFNALELEAHPELRVRTYHLIGVPIADREEDWCFRYLAYRISQRPPRGKFIQPAKFLTEVKPFYKDWMPRLFKDPVQSVVITGMEGSGRRTLLELLRSAIDNRIELGPTIQNATPNAVGGDTVLSLPGHHKISVSVASSEVAGDNKNGPSDEQKPNGAEDGDRNIENVSTIILTIPAWAFRSVHGDFPEQLLTEDGKRVIAQHSSTIERLKLGSSGKRRYYLAIGYTLADQFGVIPLENPRIIADADDLKAFIKFGEEIERTRVGGNDAAWQAFVNAVLKKATEPENSDAIQVRRALLNASRQIWEAVGSNISRGRATLNGYVLQCEPVLQAPIKDRVWHDAGGLQIFSDILVG
jgi:hypothetical protein